MASRVFSGERFWIHAFRLVKAGHTAATWPEWEGEVEGKGDCTLRSRFVRLQVLEGGRRTADMASLSFTSRLRFVGSGRVMLGQNELPWILVVESRVDLESLFPTRGSRHYLQLI